MSAVDQKENLLLSEEVFKVSYEKYKVLQCSGQHKCSQDLGAALHKKGVTAGYFHSCNHKSEVSQKTQWELNEVGLSFH